MAYDNYRRDDRGGLGRDDGFRRPSQKFTGSWSCSKCSKEITELPFEPDPARLDRLLCKDCHRERLQSFRR